MTDTSIVRVTGRRILAASGDPAIEVEVALACGAEGRASVSIAAPGTPTGESASAAACVAAVNGIAAPALEGVHAEQREDVDAALFKLNAARRRLGPESLAACSLAALKAAAAAYEVPLFRYLAASEPVRLPVPVIEMLGEAWPRAGRTPVRSVSIVPYNNDGIEAALELGNTIHARTADLLIAQGGTRGAGALGGHVAPFATGEDAIELVTRAIEAAGYLPGYDVGIDVDIGAARLYRDGLYRIGGSSFDRDAWCGLLVEWVGRYPVSSLQDPFAPGDGLGMQRLRRATKGAVRLIGDAYLASDAEMIGSAAVDGLFHGVVLQAPAAGTVSELRAAADAAARAAWEVALGTRGNDTEDVAVVHIATAWEVDYLRCGPLAGGACAAKWNEALRIEASLGALPLGMRSEQAARMVH